MTFDIPPPECDLRDYPFMPLDVARLRDSAIVDAVTGEEFRAAVLLWCAAWHQVPAGSLPDDDAQLGKFAGYGRVIKEWQKVRAGALYGFETGPDGRLYHPVIVEKALEAWAGRRSASKRGKAGADKRWGNRNSGSDALAIEENGSAISTDSSAMPLATEKHSNRQGEGKEREREKDKEVCAAFAPPIPPSPSVEIIQEEPEPEIPEFLLREPANGKRWAEGRVVPGEWITAAELKRKDHGLAPVNLHLEAEKFANYWTARSGKDATKKDWKATWMNRALSVEPPRGWQQQPNEFKILKVV